MKQYFGPFPFWIWNDRVTRDEIAVQMEMMHRQGIGEVMLCPSSGFEIEYGSVEMFKLVRFACETAERLGMSIWLYDEFNWPSGVAGGKVIDDHPDLRQRLLRCHVKSIPADGPRELALTYEEGKVVTACLVGPESRIDISAQLARWKRHMENHQSTYLHYVAKWKAPFRRGVLSVPPGSWEVVIAVETISKCLLAACIGTKWSRQTPAYVDTLNPLAIDRFMQITHKQYKRHVGEYFGTVIKGIFTDEPTMVRGHAGPKGWDRIVDIPWTGPLAGLFGRQCGYDLRTIIPELVLPTQSLYSCPDTIDGDDRRARTLRARRDFWHVVTERYLDSYHRKFRAWCDANGLVYIGHVLSDKNPSEWVTRQGDYFRCMETFHVPAIDHVWGSPNLSRGKAAYGWRTFEYVNAKVAASIAMHAGQPRVCAETFALGGYDGTLADFRHTTDFLGVLGINMMLTSGAMYSLRGNRRRLVRTCHSYQSPFWRHYHLYAAYAERLSKLLAQSAHRAAVALVYSPTDHQCADSQADKGDRLSQIVRVLLQNQIDFDFVHEDQLAKARRTAEGVRIGRGVYQTVLLPPADILNERAQRKFVSLDVSPGMVVRLGNGDWHKTVAALDSPVGLDFPSDVKSNILVNVRRLGKEDLYFICYCGQKEIDGHIVLSGRGQPVQIDMKTGREEAITHKRSGRGVRIPIHLHPRMSLAIRMTMKPQATKTRLDRKWTATSNLAGRWEIEPANGNVAFLTGWEIHEDGKWTPAKAERLYLDYPAAKGRNIRGRFDLTFMPNVLAAAFEHGLVRSLYVNRQKVQTKETPCDCLDRTTRRLDIRPYVRLGSNQIEAVLTISDYERRIDCYGQTTLAPMFLVGELATDGKAIFPQPTAIKTGTWTEQGFPYYSGSIIHRRQFLWDGRGRLLRLGVHDGVAEVAINGQPAGTQAWEPYIFDISAMLREGVNELRVEVSNTLSNLIEKVVPSGLAWAKIGILD